MLFKMKRRFAPVVSFALTLTILWSTVPVSSAQNQPRIAWSEGKVEITLSPGGTEVKNLTFTSSQALQNIRLEPVPEIAGFVTVQPSTFASVSAGQPQSVQLSFSIPQGTSAGTYEGTIHVRSGNRTIPQTLKVSIQVRRSSTNFTAFVNPGDPLLLRAETLDGKVIDYFGERDANGLATAVTSIRVRFADGEVTTILLDDQSRPVRVFTPNGVLFEILWLTQTSIVLTATSPNGSLQITLPVDLNSVDASSLTQASRHCANCSEPRVGLLGMENKYTEIASLKIPAFPIRSSKVLRSHAKVGTRAVTKAALPAVQSTSNITANVRVFDCGPEDLADVEATIVGLPFGTIAGKPQGGGLFRIDIPSPGKVAQDNIQAVKDSIIGKVASVGCDLQDALGSAGVCAAIAGTVDLFIAGPTGPEAAAIFAACQQRFGPAITAYCSSLGKSAAPGSDSVIDFIARNIGQEIDRAITLPVLVIPTVKVYGRQNQPTVTPSAQSVSFGEVAEFIADTGNGAEIQSVTTTPAYPDQGQGYTTTAEIKCVPPNTAVTMSILGSDNFQRSVTCTLNGDGTCSLTIILPKI